MQQKENKAKRVSAEYQELKMLSADPGDDGDDHKQALMKMITKLHDTLQAKYKQKRQNEEDIANQKSVVKYLKKQVEDVNSKRQEFRDQFKNEVLLLKHVSDTLIRKEDEFQFLEDQIEQSVAKNEEIKTKNMHKQKTVKE